MAGMQLGFTRRPLETAAAFPLAAQQMAAVNHFSSPDADKFFTPDHELLNQKWAWYEGLQYDGCQFDWYGAPIGGSGSVSKALVPKTTGVPPGFRSLNVPNLSQRRPTSPQRVVRRVVGRFTGLLFGDGCNPNIQCIGDEATGHWLQSFAKTSRLFPKMQSARDIGGSIGAVAVGIRALDGEPRIELFDPRFTKQIWADREAMVLRAIDIRYKIPVSVLTGRGGGRETVYYWERRLISDTADLHYKPVWVTKRVGDILDNGVEVQANPTGREPDWGALIDEEKSVRHDLGFCPVIWIQNLPKHTTEYGYSDVDGLYEQAMDIDQLRSAISSCVKANMDPTLVVSNADGKFPDGLKKGTGNGIAVQAPGTVQYLEAGFGSVTVAMNWFEQVIDLFFKEADCLELAKDGGGAPQTATEVNQKIGPQQAKTGRLREQYGQLGVRKLLQMAVKMERVLNTRGQGFTELEPRVTEVSDGEDKVEQVQLGKGGYIDVDWPPIARPSIAEVAQAATAAVAAKTGGVVDTESIVKWLSPYFGADDIGAILARLTKEKEEAQAQQQMGFGGSGQPEEPGVATE